MAEGDGNRLEDRHVLAFRERKLNHTRNHMVEFAVIVASADALLALVLGGRMAERQQGSAIALVASILILIASLLAVGLLYY